MELETVLFELLELVCISQTQQNILKAIAELNEPITATQFVQRRQNIPHSTTWHNLRFLRRKQLIFFGEQKPIQLTHTGLLVMKHLEAKK